MNNEMINLVKDDDSVERLDAFLGKNIENVSRSYIQKIIENDGVTINGEKIFSKKMKVKKGDEIAFQLPEPKELDIVAEDIPLDIFYEDDDLLIINKPQGMTVHPAPGNYNGTLVNALMFHVDKLSSINGVIRPGIVHRIDKDTSGLLMVAKTDHAHQSLAQQLKDKTTIRKYYALVHGVFGKPKGTVNAPIARHPKDRLRMAIVKDGKQAVTHYKVLETYNKYSLVELKLETGRTHQIRVHMASINHPIVGDPVYGMKKEKVKFAGQLLHAKIIGFVHPTTNEEMIFESDLPDYFVEMIEKVKKIK